MGGDLGLHSKLNRGELSPIFSSLRERETKRGREREREREREETHRERDRERDRKRHRELPKLEKAIC